MNKQEKIIMFGVVAVIIMVFGFIYFIRNNQGLVVTNVCSSSEQNETSTIQTALTSKFITNVSLLLSSTCKGDVVKLVEYKKLANKIVYYNETPEVTITTRIINITDPITNITTENTTQDITTRQIKTYYWCSDNGNIILSTKDGTMVEKYFSSFYVCNSEDLCLNGVSDCTDTQKCTSGKCYTITTTDCPVPYKISNHTCKAECNTNNDCQLSQECIPGSIKELGICKDLVCKEKEIPQNHVCLVVECNLDSHCFVDKDVTCDGVSERINGTCDTAANHTCVFPEIKKLTGQELSTFSEVNDVKCSAGKLFYNQNKGLIFIGSGIILVGGLLGGIFYFVRKKK